MPYSFAISFMTLSGNVYLYAKQTDDIKQFQLVLELIKKFYDYNEVFISREPRRSFGELEHLKDNLGENDVCIITNPASLGLNEADIAAQLDWFIKKPRILLIYDYNTTYMFGVSEPLNQAILQTIQQSLTGNKQVVKIPENRKSNAGRSRIDYPDNWSELYERWEKEEISSKEFLEQSGLKKATFYNMISSYRAMMEENDKFIGMYKRM